LLALVYALLEFVWIFIKEKEGKSGDKLLLAGGDDLDLVLSLFVVIAEDLNWFPLVLIALVDRREGMGLARF